MADMRPAIFAHRGASAVAPENTIEAFTLARELGADGVELDVRRTADGVLIVHHDPTLAGSDTPLIAMTRAEVAVAAPQVPDLETALAACDGIAVDIEIKNAPYEPDWDPDDLTLREVIGVIGDGVFVSSFNVETVRRSHAAGVTTGWLLTRAMDPLDVLAEWPGYEFVLPGSDAVTGPRLADVVVAARGAETRIGVWTVDEADAIERLADAPVDIVFTNDPGLARSVVG